LKSHGERAGGAVRNLFAVYLLVWINEAPREIGLIEAFFCDAHVTIEVANAMLRLVRAALQAIFFGEELFVAKFGFTIETCEIVIVGPSGIARPIIFDVTIRNQTIIARFEDNTGFHRFDGRVQI